MKKEELPFSGPDGQLRLAKEMERTAGINARLKRVEGAVRPVYIGDANGTLTQTGSCVLLSLADEVFLLSAAHVLAGAEDGPLHIGHDNAAIHLKLHWTASASGHTYHQDDPVDVAVGRLRPEHADLLRAGALTLDDTDWHPSSFPDSVTRHVAVGFRANQSEVRDGALESGREIYHSGKLAEELYRARKIDRTRFLSLDFNSNVWTNGIQRSKLNFAGMSGGGMFEVRAIEDGSGVIAVEARLAGIITECLPRENGLGRTLFGPRVGFHLAMIEDDFPGLVG